MDLKRSIMEFDLWGRFQKIIDMPPIYVDVCHNNYAALQLLIELKNLKKDIKKKIIAIFNIQKQRI